MSVKKNGGYPSPLSTVFPTSLNIAVIFPLNISVISLVVSNMFTRRMRETDGYIFGQKYQFFEMENENHR